MKLDQRIKPISYLKAHSAEIIREIGDGAGPMVITQNGEAKAVLQDVASYERAQETLALLKLLALGQADVAGFVDRDDVASTVELATVVTIQKIGCSSHVGVSAGDGGDVLGLGFAPGRGGCHEGYQN